ncbi:MAG: ABC transporter ATP-binding protein [Deltaproteobacteria bacterium]|nr:ABC transporter ATP-binding protein [Deltaproteobacteria bacterium]
MSLLEISGLHVSYGAIRAIRGVDFSVEEGSIVTLIGANGAGKTTLLSAIAGLLKPSSGSVRFAGEEITGLKAHQAVSRGLSLVPEGRAIFANLTVQENLQLGAYLRKDGIADDIGRMLTLFPVLNERYRQNAGTLSGGEQQMLAIARALMARPRLLLLDEPSLGLAPLVVRTIFETIREISRSGTTVLLVEQNARMALETASHAHVLETGEIVLSGPSSELASSARVKAAYLGD